MRYESMKHFCTRLLSAQTDFSASWKWFVTRVLFYISFGDVTRCCDQTQAGVLPFELVLALFALKWRWSFLSRQWKKKRKKKWSLQLRLNEFQRKATETQNICLGIKLKPGAFLCWSTASKHRNLMYKRTNWHTWPLVLQHVLVKWGRLERNHQTELRLWLCCDVCR